MKLLCDWINDERYPALRVAYVEERELISEQETDTVKSNKKTGKVYSSVLVKGGVNGHDQVMESFAITVLFIQNKQSKQMKHSNCFTI